MRKHTQTCIYSVPKFKDASGPGCGAVAGPCEHENEPSVSIKGEGFLY